MRESIVENLRRDQFQLDDGVEIALGHEGQLVIERACLTVQNAQPQDSSCPAVLRTTESLGPGRRARVLLGGIECLGFKIWGIQDLKVAGLGLPWNSLSTRAPLDKGMTRSVIRTPQTQTCILDQKLRFETSGDLR